MQTKWRLSHAQGYLGLGMVAEAAAELDRIPARERRATEVVALRMTILQEQQDWAALVPFAAEFVRREPAEISGWITWAYATRRADSLAAAQKILLAAIPHHPKAAMVQFNLACYASQLGQLDDARHHLELALALDKDFTALAKTDPDLAALREATPDNSSAD
ncbi:MAG: hypothetical protein RLZZ15_3676 [Verrucomicrobiota bacterium]|jgi:tetratricopeptide (TPR) repeat protein